MDKDISIQYIKGVGPRRAALLGRLGIKTVQDSLYYLPYRYEDRSNIRPIGSLTLMDTTPQTVIGKVISTGVKKVSNKLKLFELGVSDGTGIVLGKWFNQPFLSKQFKHGQEVVLSGTVRSPYRGRWFEMENPEYEFAGDDTDGLIHTGRIVPVYRTTEHLSSRQLRAIIHNVLKLYLDVVKDPLHEELLRRNKLLRLKEAIMCCHFPGAEADVSALNSWQSACQRRLIFDELFMLEMGLAVLKSRRLKEKGIAFGAKGHLISRLRNTLPYTLTAHQQKALTEIIRDMKSPYPMNRLLQGDVGSGKTIVAIMAMLFAVESGYQSALMAPTELLAEQHYINIHHMLEELGLKVCLLTGSSKKQSLRDALKGKADIIIGTHALLEEGVRFGRLGLAVIDEQHRFGVRQRATLRKKGDNPDILVMTATPIPRTLAMTFYGDLDYSSIEKPPPGRTPVTTRLYSQADKNLLYSEIDSEVKQRGQVYIVYPAIEESEILNLKSAILGERAIKKLFPSMRVSLMHSKVKPGQREAIMNAFKCHEIDILVSTTVIEVGVDIPNASLMIIVNAERFGLAQLHQLRGRVGRGRRRSRCFLVAYEPLSQDARERLDAIVRTSDGFKVADRDLAIRGPGEMLGTKQSGMPDLKIADIMRDAKLVETARQEAFSLLDRDSRLEGHPELRSRLEGFWNGKVELFKTA